MGQGIAFPFKESYGKGIEMAYGADYTRQLILVALGNCQSDNPFQDLGIDSEPIFANLSSSGVRGWLSKKFRDIFLSLERQELAKLIKLEFKEGVEDPARPASGQEAELTAVVTYLDLEMDLEQDLAVRFPLGG